MADFDLVILGGGSGGYAAALRVFQLRLYYTPARLQIAPDMQQILA
jgi:hypothetical protein